MRLLSLCTGYGGLDLAIESILDVEMVAVAEFDPKASLVCEARFHGVPNLGDIKAIDWDSIGSIDIMSAGYPCQPFSQAGKRLGEEDPRHIWPYISEGIRHLRPQLIVLENVSGHRSKGFGTVLGDLATMRYDVKWASVRASDVGAPHRRERVFIVATNSDVSGYGGQENLEAVGGLDCSDEEAAWKWKWSRSESVHRSAQIDSTSTNANCMARNATGTLNRGPEKMDESESIERTERLPRMAWGNYELAIRRWGKLTRAHPIPVDGLGLRPEFVEWMMGLPEGWVTDVPGISRSKQLHILGNGVVPQQAVFALRHLLGG